MIAVSAALPDTPRLLIWAAVVAGWVLGNFAMAIGPARTSTLGASSSESLVERFGLFVIIVLGEVMVGVVTGISEAERDSRTIATGMLALIIGFGL